MNHRRTAIGMVALAAAATFAPASQAVALSPADPAPPVDNEHACWQAGFERTPPGTGGEALPAFYCENLPGAEIYTDESWPEPADHLRTTTSWFLCKQDDGPPNGEEHPHPNRWLYTLGDDNGEWGFVSDIDIHSETDPIPNCDQY